MYTWSYVKEATLAKLDMTANQAIQMGLLNKFPYYANEAITQITSAIKPKRAYVEFDVCVRAAMLDYFKHEYNLTDDDLKFLFDTKLDIKTLTVQQKEIYDTYHSKEYINDIVNMPDDFFAWSDDINFKYDMYDGWIEADDEDYYVYGDNKIVFKHSCKYRIAYYARWFTFDPSTPDDTELRLPEDILDCLPSYIASQCFKIDDEQKSSIYRNEYEMFLARINDNSYGNNKNMHIKGDW